MFNNSSLVSLMLSLILACSLVVDQSTCVVVDGSKKKDISATKKQAPEKTMIDAFNTKTCGLSDPNFNEHEFVNMAREGQFPWMASFQIEALANASHSAQEKVAHETLQQTKNSGNKVIEDLHFCCGSFISDKWILSAAHCFAPDTIKTYLENGKLKVVAGSHRVSSRAPINRNLTIQRIYYHSQFDKAMPVGFDVALVELKYKVEFSHKRQSSPLGEQAAPFMNTICLPLKDKRYKFNETARVAGWGLSEAKDSSSMPSKLLTTDILLNNQDECVERYVKSLKSDRPRQQKKKYDDFICAGFKNTRDACQSDSGGPLMQYSGGKAVVIGIVSYGIGCATKGVPGLYTRTSAYINWIKDITKNGKDASVAYKLIEAKDRSGVSKTEASATTSTERPEVPTRVDSSNTPQPRVREATKKRRKTTTTTTSPPTTTTTRVASPPPTIGSKNKNIGGFKFFDEN